MNVLSNCPPSSTKIDVPTTSIPSNISFQPLSHDHVTGGSLEPRVENKKLAYENHHSNLLEAAQNFCVEQEYVDLAIHCEDGVIYAHQVVLAVASPFLKQLFEMSPSRGVELVAISLPEVKSSLVQALVHFVYTGNVVTQEGKFYSLMKLVYSLNINASIEAESTRNQPTAFRTIVNIGKKGQDLQLDIDKRHTKEQSQQTLDDGEILRKRIRLDNGGSESVTRVTSQPLTLTRNVTSGTGGVVVNSLTASGVVVKEEPEEKPNILVPVQLNMNGVNTHFVSVPQYPVKVELPSQPVPVAGNVGLRHNQPQPQPGVSVTKESGGSDDPLAAIMNQTIFGGGADAMFIVGSQVNGKPFLDMPAGSCPPGTVAGKEEAPAVLPRPPPATSQPQHQDEESPNKGAQVQQLPSPRGLTTAESVDDLPCTPDDEDLNISYNCETCNRSIKGRVMLQAHQYQEHYDNPEYEAASFPDDKFACRVCLKLFTRNSDVKAHILRVHCGDRRYPCTMCGKRFKESTHLRKHLYTHTGERPHYCHLCTKGFQTSSDLKRHKRTRVHQERVEQLSTGRLADSDGAPMDTNAEYNRWTDEEDIDSPSPLNSVRQANASNLPLNRLPGTVLSSSRLPSSTIPPTTLSKITWSPQPKPPTPRLPTTSRSPPSTTIARPVSQTFSPRPSFSSPSASSLSSTMTMPSICSTSSLLNLPNSQYQYSTPTSSLPNSNGQFPSPVPHYVTQQSSQFSSSIGGVQASQYSTTTVKMSENGDKLETSPFLPNQFTSGPSSQFSANSSQPNITQQQPNQYSSTSSQSLQYSSVPTTTQQSLTLGNTTIDISDIKWGLGGSILESRDGLSMAGEPRMSHVITLKRSGSTDSPQDGERLTIQEEDLDT